jgi:hypothetical protein
MSTFKSDRMLPSSSSIIVLEPLGCESAQAWIDRRGSKRRKSAEKVRVRDGARMSELGEDYAPFLVDRLSYLVPAINLRGRKQARYIDETNRVPAHPRSLCQDQAGAGALPVVLDLQVVRDVSRVSRPPPSHRRHDDAVLECDLAKSEGRKEGQDVLVLSQTHHVLGPALVIWLIRNFAVV